MADVKNNEFDYIVVGAGSGGCVVAGRLAESGSSVLLLEAGVPDRNPWIHIPIGIGKLYDNPRLNWCYSTEPEVGLGGKRIFQPRGKVMGGTSSINGMCYVRGRPSDYDNWRDLGCEGWGWEDVLPFFKKSEDFVGGAGPYHGAGGPLRISTQKHWELADRFIDACEASGIPKNDDFNGARQEGAGYYHRNTDANLRVSSARAFLANSGSMPNLTIETVSAATRIIVEDGRATGVEYARRGKCHVARARRETVISCGAFNTPQLLKLSGIGPAAQLNRQGIGVVLDQPEVGKNLQDHCWVRLAFKCTKPITINEFARSLPKQAAAAVQYAIFRDGPLATTGVTAGAFVRSDDQVAEPDLQLNFLGWSMTNEGTSRVNPDPFPGFSIILVDLDPGSIGDVRLRDADPFSPPEIRLNYLRGTHTPDRLVRGIKLIRKIMAQDPIAPLIAEELEPGAGRTSDADLADFVAANCMSNQHAVGSCRMGSDAGSVVDPRLRVRGIEGLRIADASIMPVLVRGNTNAPIMMIGEKAASMIFEDATGQTASAPLDKQADSLVVAGH